jgi:hypothetical protein
MILFCMLEKTEMDRQAEQKRQKEQTDSLRDRLAALEGELASVQTMFDAAKLAEIKTAREYNDFKSRSAAELAVQLQMNERCLRDLNDQSQSTSQRIQELESQNCVSLTKLTAMEAELQLAFQKLAQAEEQASVLHSKLSEDMKTGSNTDSQEDSVLMNLLTDELEEVDITLVYFMFRFTLVAIIPKSSHLGESDCSGHFGYLASDLKRSFFQNIIYLVVVVSVFSNLVSYFSYFYQRNDALFNSEVPCFSSCTQPAVVLLRLIFLFFFSFFLGTLQKPHFCK